MASFSRVRFPLQATLSSGAVLTRIHCNILGASDVSYSAEAEKALSWHCDRWSTLGLPAAARSFGSYDSSGYLKGSSMTLKYFQELNVLAKDHLEILLNFLKQHLAV